MHHGYLRISSSSSSSFNSSTGFRGVIGLSVGLSVAPETLLGLDMKVASEARRGLGIKVVSDARLGLDIAVISLSLHSTSLWFSTKVGSLPRLPMLATVSSTSPFSQQPALSYLSKLFLRLGLCDLGLNDRLFLCRTAGATRAAFFEPRNSPEPARDEEKSSVRQGMILLRNLCLRLATWVIVDAFELLHCHSLRNSRSMGVALVLKLNTQRVTSPRRIGTLAIMMATLFSMWLTQ